MSQIVRTCTFTSTDSVDIQDIKGNLSRWINDSSNFGFGFGHFSTPVTDSKIGPGCLIQISNIWYRILYIRNSGNNLGEVQLDKNPPLGKINKIQGLQISNGSIHIPLYDSTYNTSTGHLIEDEIIGNGKDGNLVISGISSINNYATIVGSSSFNCGSDSISVSTTSGFSVGDEIFIIQMQHSDSSRVGQYQTNFIKSISGTRITLKEPLCVSFDSSNAGGTSVRSVAQIVRIPNYISVIVNGQLSCQSWNGYTGGVLIFRCQNDIIINGSIDVSGRGFRGAQNPGNVVLSDQIEYGGYRGEGCYGLHGLYNGDSGGGGYCSGYCAGSQNFGGAYCVPGSGGGFGSDGGIGYEQVTGQACSVNTTTAGHSLFNSELLQLTPGPGGSSCKYGYAHSYSSGGSGGGICILLGKNLKISSSGRIYSNGIGYSNIQGGGGGAGGPILLYFSKLIQNSGIIQATGGSGHSFFYLPYDPVLSPIKYGADIVNIKFGSVQSGAGGDGRIVRYSGQYIGNQPIVNNGSSIITSNSQNFMKFGLLPNKVSWLGVGYLFETPKYNIENAATFDSINLTYSLKCTNDIIRVALKFDNNSYIIWNGSKWVNINYDDIVTLGMTPTTLAAIGPNIYLNDSCFIRGMKTIQLGVSITSYGKYSPASISQIDIYYTLRTWRLWNIQVPRMIYTVTPNEIGKFMNRS